jgi:hypothetical protein
MSSDPSAPLRPSDLMVDDEVRLAAEIVPLGISPATLDGSPRFAVGDLVERDVNGMALEITGVRIGPAGEDVQLNHQPAWFPAATVRPTQQEAPA